MNTTIENTVIDKLIELKDQIGNTPLFDFSALVNNPKVKLFAKLEWEQLGGSVKARAAYEIIRSAIASGELSGKRLLDASSGNTAIAYATIAKELGIGVTLVIPENATQERKDILSGLGAEIIFSSPFEGTDGSQVLAAQLAKGEADRYYYANQYANPANWKAHYKGTAAEILLQTEQKITHFVSALGTTGTFTGTGRRLKEEKSKIRLIQLQPDSPMHGLEGWKDLETAIVPKIFDNQLSDENRYVNSDEAIEMIKRVIEEFDIKLSPSSAASLLGATQVANEIEDGVVVTVLADNYEKYSEVYRDRLNINI